MLVTAGFGTRLAPLTDELPKPALPVGNRPAAWFALDHLHRSGVREVVLNTHHLADVLRAEVERCMPSGMTVRFVHEPRILGTGGGLRNAWRPIDGEAFLVVNGKVLFAPDLARLIEHHRQSGAIATLVVQPMPAGGGFAPVEIDTEGRVRRVRGKPEAAQPGLRACMYASVQVLDARAWRDLPEDGDVVEGAWLPWIARGERVMAFVDESPFIDVGVSLRGYLEANLMLARGALKWPGIEPGQGAVLDAGAHWGAGARGAHVVVGAGARIADGARVERVVAWRDASVGGDLADAIVTTRGETVRV